MLEILRSLAPAGKAMPDLSAAAQAGGRQAAAPQGIPPSGRRDPGGAVASSDNRAATGDAHDSAPSPGPAPDGGAGSPGDGKDDAQAPAAGHVASCPSFAGAAGRAGRAIQLGPEEAGVFLLAAVVLAVLAFLMGWYARGMASPGPAARHALRPGGSPAQPMLAIDGARTNDLGQGNRGVESVADGRQPEHTIVVVSFPAGGAAEAQDHKYFLMERGFAPAWVRLTRQGVDICVGRFSSPRDALAVEWLPKISRLREAYGSARIEKVR